MSQETPIKLTTADLWRIDLTHELGGMATYFRERVEQAEELAVTMRINGWHAAIRPERDFIAAESTVARMCQFPWPNIEAKQISQMCHEPSAKQAQAMSDLKRAIAKRPRR